MAQVPQNLPQGDDWMSYQDAATRLGVSLPRIAMLQANEILEPSEHSLNGSGVTESSVQREITWQATASIWMRIVRTTRSFFMWF